MKVNYFKSKAIETSNDRKNFAQFEVSNF